MKLIHSERFSCTAINVFLDQASTRFLMQCDGLGACGFLRTNLVPETWYWNSQFNPEANELQSINCTGPYTCQKYREGCPLSCNWTATCPNDCPWYNCTDKCGSSYTANQGERIAESNMVLPFLPSSSLLLSLVLQVLYCGALRSFGINAENSVMRFETEGTNFTLLPRFLISPSESNHGRR